MEGRGLNVTQTGNKLLCSHPPLLSGAQERFIPNFVLVQSILLAYLTQYVLPGAYITDSVERYESTKFTSVILKSLIDHIFIFTQTSMPGQIGVST